MAAADGTATAHRTPQRCCSLFHSPCCAVSPETMPFRACMGSMRNAKNKYKWYGGDDKGAQRAKISTKNLCPTLAIGCSRTWCLWQPHSAKARPRLARRQSCERTRATAVLMVSLHCLLICVRCYSSGMRGRRSFGGAGRSQRRRTSNR